MVQLRAAAFPSDTVPSTFLPSLPRSCARASFQIYPHCLPENSLNDSDGLSDHKYSDLLFPFQNYFYLSIWIVDGITAKQSNNRLKFPYQDFPHAQALMKASLVSQHSVLDNTVTQPETCKTHTLTASHWESLYRKAWHSYLGYSTESKEILTEIQALQSLALHALPIPINFPFITNQRILSPRASAGFPKPGLFTLYPGAGLRSESHPQALLPAHLGKHPRGQQHQYYSSNMSHTGVAEQSPVSSSAEGLMQFKLLHPSHFTAWFWQTRRSWVAAFSSATAHSDSALATVFQGFHDEAANSLTKRFI